MKLSAAEKAAISKEEKEIIIEDLQSTYTGGDSHVLAFALNDLYPERYETWRVLITKNGIYPGDYEADGAELNEFVPWHWFNRDVLTNEFVDAYGRHATLKDLTSEWRMFTNNPSLQFQRIEPVSGKRFAYAYQSGFEPKPLDQKNDWGSSTLEDIETLGLHIEEKDITKKAAPQHFAQDINELYYYDSLTHEEIEAFKNYPQSFLKTILSQTNDNRSSLNRIILNILRDKVQVENLKNIMDKDKHGNYYVHPLVQFFFNKQKELGFPSSTVIITLLDTTDSVNVTKAIYELNIKPFLKSKKLNDEYDKLTKHLN